MQITGSVPNESFPVSEITWETIGKSKTQHGSDDDDSSIDDIKVEICEYGYDSDCSDESETELANFADEDNSQPVNSFSYTAFVFDDVDDECEEECECFVSESVNTANINVPPPLRDSPLRD